MLCVGYIDGEFVLNPTASEMANSTLDLRVAGTEDAILMVEAPTKYLEDVMPALRVAHEGLQGHHPDAEAVRRHRQAEV
ncbi:MAG: hypothetical protein M9927_23370 [Anaerolineae bacterium]|nr:hypothetical protein [Anaerolineae bacterium]